ncbi:MAG TPA: 16S rRNA (cytidine(1402)-2'-O)-methyltransferase [Clostridia bacterium]|nr:16S rRNA (cytidine(1402)-2'-O)-methyltransferase [Clostridia bacterium]
MSGRLYLCGTPIGNLEDITLRALATLKEVDLIAAEDTRHTLKLLNHYQIKKKLISYHEHNRKQRGREIIELLKAGKNIALVSDAGMPGISDPGTDLVRLALENDLEVVPIPGPTAFVTGLVVSGFPTDSFIFMGFVPKSKKERQELWAFLKEEKRTTVFYESPHRLLATLEEAEEELGGERPVVVARELTKTFEEVRRGSLSEVREWFAQKPVKGEITIIFSGVEKEREEMDESVLLEEGKKEVMQLISSGMSHNEAVKNVAKKLNLSKRELYNFVLKSN